MKRHAGSITRKSVGMVNLFALIVVVNVATNKKAVSITNVLQVNVIRFIRLLWELYLRQVILL